MAPHSGAATAAITASMCSGACPRGRIPGSRGTIHPRNSVYPPFRLPRIQRSLRAGARNAPADRGRARYPAHDGSRLRRTRALRAIASISENPRARFAAIADASVQPVPCVCCVRIAGPSEVAHPFVGARNVDALRPGSCPPFTSTTRGTELRGSGVRPRACPRSSGSASRPALRPQECLA